MLLGTGTLETPDIDSGGKIYRINRAGGSVAEQEKPADDIHVRRVQVTGGSTFIVSLPKSWAKANGLAAGDTLALAPAADGSLRVEPARRHRREPQKATLDAEQLSGEALLRRLIGAYLAGNDVIEVSTPGRFTKAQRESIRRFTRICAGPEILEETARRVLLKDLVDPREVTPSNVLTRIYLIARSMVRDAVDALEADDAPLAQDVRARDDDVDRLYRLGAKRFAKTLREGSAGDATRPYDGLRLLLCSRILERCADHADRVAENLLRVRDTTIGPSTRKQLVAFGREATSLFERAFESFTGSDHTAADAVIQTSNQLAGRKADLLRTIARREPDSVVGLSLLLESLERVHQYASDIAELALNAAGPDQ